MKQKALLMSAMLAALTMLLPGAVSADAEWYLGIFSPLTKLNGSVSYSFNGVTVPTSLKLGAGLGGKVGVGLGEYIAVEGSFFRSTHDAGSFPSVDFTGNTLDLKVRFPVKGISFEVEPYLLGGLGLYQLRSSINTYKGNGYQYGLGVRVPFESGFSVSVGYTMRNMTFDEGTLAFFLGLPVKVQYDEKARSFDFSLSYHFR